MDYQGLAQLVNIPKATGESVASPESHFSRCNMSGLQTLIQQFSDDSLSFDLQTKPIFQPQLDLFYKLEHL